MTSRVSWLESLARWRRHPLFISSVLVGLFAAPATTFASFVRTAIITAIPIGSATLAAMFARLIQNGWAHGSISDALYEFYLALLHRVFNVTPVPSEPLDLASIVHVVVHRTQFSFNLDWTGVLTALASLAFRRFLPDEVPIDISADSIAAMLEIIASSMLAITTPCPSTHFPGKTNRRKSSDLRSYCGLYKP